jgi:hypothetical protein
MRETPERIEREKFEIRRRIRSIDKSTAPCGHQSH